MIFIAGGKLFFHEEGRILEHLSPFAREKTADEEKQQKSDQWKNEAAEDPGNALFSRQALWGTKSACSKAVPPRFRYAAQVGGRIYYTLTLSRTNGLLYYDPELKKETRLFHKEDFQPKGFFLDDQMRIFTTRTNADLSTHIIRMDSEGKNPTLLTGGDCIDENPFVRNGILYYQTAGIGRNEQGLACSWSPIAIQRIDLGTGDTLTLAEAPTFDFLLPKADGAGNVYCIRRPHRHVSDYPWSTFFWDILAFPYRLFMGILGFLDTFTRLFGKTPLKTAGGPEGHSFDAAHRVILGQWMNVVEASKKAGRPVAVPGDWQLIRISPDGSHTVIADHVVGYDLDRAGEIVYTNGFEILKADGGKLHESKELIELVALT